MKRGNQTKELWENLKAEIKISNQREKYKSGSGRVPKERRRGDHVKIGRKEGKKYVQVEKIKQKRKREGEEGRGRGGAKK